MKQKEPCGQFLCRLALSLAYWEASLIHSVLF